MALLVNSCYNSIVYYANGADKMKPIGSRIQGGQQCISGLGTDPLTTILVGLALVLTAAITALGVDLWLRPENESPVLQAYAPKEPARLVIAAPLEPSPTPSPSPTAITYPAAIRIRIPAVGVDRSIIEVPLAYDSRSET